jgi:two-component system sensor histidine kinase CreC
MKLGTHIFICFFLIFGVCFYYPIDWIIDNLRIRYLEGVEDPLVDQAHLLAGIAADQMQRKTFDADGWYRIFGDVHHKELSARIYDLEKRQVDMQVYITDAGGKVLFDSRDRGLVGSDYSRWRDVRLTLDGKYGARTTRRDENVPESSVLFVAAPILLKGTIAGVLTVAKPTTNINNFLEDAQPRIFRAGLLSLGVALLLSLLACIWITRPIKRLTRYANHIRLGRRQPVPPLGFTEIRDMGNAFERMQEALEGKKYVEQYIQKLTHELKSPLSAIRGGAELLEEEMPEERRARFVANIRNEANRIQQIVDRMLELSELESRKVLHKTDRVAMRSLVSTVLESKQPMLAKNSLRVAEEVPDDTVVHGDAFLLHQAVSNLVQNAIDFSPLGATIGLTVACEEDRAFLVVEDEGPGIPDFARDMNPDFARVVGFQRQGAQGEAVCT